MTFAGATVAAFYGPKSPPFASFLAGLQGLAGDLLPGFAPRSIEQIHATVLGLEFPIRPTTRQDVRDVLAHLHAQLGAAPVPIRFGGFGPGEAGFRSRNRTPYERSFSVSRRLAVLIGWPADAVQRLAELRYDAERFGFRHRYHGLGLDPDPDCYLVIGEVPPEAGDAGLEEMRSYLSAHPFTVPLGAADASVVLYRSTELPRATSVAIPLAEAGERNDGTDAIAAVVRGDRPD